MSTRSIACRGRYRHSPAVMTMNSQIPRLRVCSATSRRQCPDSQRQMRTRTHLGRLVSTLLELQGERERQGESGCDGDTRDRPWSVGLPACSARPIPQTERVSAIPSCLHGEGTPMSEKQVRGGAHLLDEVEDRVGEGRIGERERLGVDFGLQKHVHGAASVLS